jgi:hypothetical protein
MEAVDSLVGPGSRNTLWVGVFRMKTIVQPQSEVSLRIAGDRRWRKHSNRCASPRGPWLAERTTLRREHFNVSSMGPNPRVMKAGQRPNRRIRSRTVCRCGTIHDSENRHDREATWEKKNQQDPKMGPSRMRSVEHGNNWDSSHYWGCYQATNAWT